MDGESFAHDDRAQRIALAMQREAKRATGEATAMHNSTTPSLVVGDAMCYTRAMRNLRQLEGALASHTGIIDKPVEELIDG